MICIHVPLLLRPLVSNLLFSLRYTHTHTHKILSHRVSLFKKAKNTLSGKGAFGSLTGGGEDMNVRNTDSSPLKQMLGAFEQHQRFEK